MNSGRENNINKKRFLSINLWINLVFLSLALSAASCLPENTSETKSSGARGSGGTLSSPASVNPGFGRILSDNPIILSRNANLSPEANLDSWLSNTPEFIVLDQHLNKRCELSPGFPAVNNCVRVKKDENFSQITNSSARWAYSTRTDEFHEVNTFAHMQRIIQRYFSVFKERLESPYSTTVPGNYLDSKAFWLSDRTLWGYANCNLLDNASFSPSKFSICMGKDSEFSNMRWAQDSTIIYHEMGHAFNYILTNTRNTADPAILERSALRTFFYDEGGSIDEGISDYASYFMNGRTKIGEWAMGRLNQAARPMSEAESIHIPGINTTSSGRLSYPTYVTYDPNFPSDPLEDVHFAGQIISHYLVALTEDIQHHCHISNSRARDLVMFAISESLTKLGDLTAKGSDSNPEGHINHSRAHAREWIRINNPINFRSFSQSMARKVKNIIVDNNQLNCDYTTDDHERLLDSYGLLLFRTYNESGNHKDYGHMADFDTRVLSSNRIKTVLVPKELLKLNPDVNSSQAFIFDNRSDMVSAIEILGSGGQIQGISTQIPGNLPYNNGNGRISPGEVIGIVPNLYNDSNSQIGGVQILANDWDHFKWTDTHNDKPYSEGRPCPIDGFPSFSQGGADTSSETGHNPGECSYITRENGDEDYEQLAPFCMVQVNEDDSAKWSGQNALRRKIQLEQSKCLNPDNPNDCFIRSIPGANAAYFSHIDPKSTWAETVSPDGAPNFNLSNLIFMEISPWVPPGTTFQCRFRARFTNCEDCFHDPQTNGLDYKDYEYSGHRPFQILNFRFTVID